MSVSAAVPRLMGQLEFVGLAKSVCSNVARPLLSLDMALGVVPYAVVAERGGAAGGGQG